MKKISDQLKQKINCLIYNPEKLDLYNKTVKEYENQLRKERLEDGTSYCCGEEIESDWMSDDTYCTKCRTRVGGNF